MDSLDKLFNIVKNTFSDRFIINKTSNSIVFSTTTEKFTNQIYFNQGYYSLGLESKELKELMSALNISINSKSYDYFIDKYSSICHKYGTFSSIRDPKKISNKKLQDFVLKKRGIIVVKQFHFQSLIKKYSNMNLRFMLDSNLTPIFEILVPIHSIKKEYVFISMKFNKDNIDKSILKLEKKIKRYTIKLIHANFPEITVEQLNSMDEDSLKDYITLCKMLQY